MSTSPSLALPYLMPAQAQKHVTHNAALQLLDMLVQLRVEEFDRLIPPTAPVAGTTYALGTGCSGDFAGQDGRLARYEADSWTFFDPLDGLLALDLATDRLRLWRSGAWQAPELGQVAQLGIATTADATNRLALASEASLFSHAGAGHQLKINKSGPADTASLLFQSGWSGRAEIGLAGSDSCALKVSPDGSSWHIALIADQQSGAVTLSKRFFSLGRAADQTGVPHQSHTRLAFDLAHEDAANLYDSALGRLQPPAGGISALAGAYVTGLTAGAICSLGIWKNGSNLIQKVYYAAAGGDLGMDVALQDRCSGSDYYEVMLYVSTAGTATVNSNSANTYWRGFHH